MSECVAVIGAGLSGLSCAYYLKKQGLGVRVYDSLPHIGGKLKSDEIDGFQLDRGFQVYFTSYEEPKKIINDDALELKSFKKGAYIYRDNKLFAMNSLFSNYPSLKQKWNLLKFSKKIKKDKNFNSNPISTELHKYFSKDFVESFFRPFLAGITLDKTLSIESSQVFEILSNLIHGQTALPSHGMQSLALEIAKGLDISLNSKITNVHGTTITFKSGEKLNAKAVVIATDAYNGTNLLMDYPRPDGFKSVTTIYFSAPKSPLKKPMLLLNAQKESLINHVCVLSDVQPSYSPPNHSLICVNLIGLYNEESMDKVLSELRSIFGEQVNAWKFLKLYGIERAHPIYHKKNSIRLGAGRYLAGDACHYPSIDKAVLSGREAAEAVVEDFLYQK